MAGTGTLELVSSSSRSAGNLGAFPAAIDLVNFGGTCCPTLADVVVDRVVALVAVALVAVALVVVALVVASLVVVPLDVAAVLVEVAATVLRIVVGGVITFAFLEFLSCTFPIAISLSLSSAS